MIAMVGEVRICVDDSFLPTHDARLAYLNQTTISMPWDKIRNTEIRRRLGCTHDIIHRIQQRRLRYFGHISRMANYRYPRIAMKGYVHGQRSKGRPKRRWIDGLKEDCALLNLTIQDGGSTAQDRRTWRGLVKELPLRATASPGP